MYISSTNQFQHILISTIDFQRSCHTPVNIHISSSLAKLVYIVQQDKISNRLKKRFLNDICRTKHRPLRVGIEDTGPRNAPVSQHK
jgi:hypothetical protein